MLRLIAWNGSEDGRPSGEWNQTTDDNLKPGQPLQYPHGQNISWLSKQKGADKNVLNAIDQMRELHRNPISHPDVNLSIDEAMMLVGLAQSAIVAMAADSQRRESESRVKS